MKKTVSNIFIGVIIGASLTACAFFCLPKPQPKIEIKEVAIKYHPRSYEKGKKIKARDAIIGALKLVRIRFGLD